MITRYTHHKVTWLDVLNPTADEIRDIFDECAFPAECADDLTSPTPQTQTLLFKNALKITLDFPIVKRTDINHPHEVKFLVTKTHLATIRFEDMEHMHRFGKEYEVVSMIGKKTKRTAVHVFLTLLTHLYEGLNSKLDHLGTRLSDVQESIMDDEEKRTLHEISDIARRLIMFKQTLVAHERALTELKNGIDGSFGKGHMQTVEHIEHLYEHLVRRSTTMTTTLDDLRDTTNAVLTMKQNEVMKTLTIMAFITFPLTLFTSLFGMNTATTPLVGYRHDFWIILGIMLLVSVGFFAYFKYKKWM